MSTRFLKRKWVRSLRPWIVPITIVTAVAALYRWSEPTIVPPHQVTQATSRKVGIHLDNAPFAAYPGGRKTWSLWAKGVDLEHPQYAPATSIDSASLEEIRDGILYEETRALLPDMVPRVTSRAEEAGPSGPPTVRFHSKAGHYYIGGSQPLPAELTGSYSAQWQLELSGDVAISTRDGNSLHAPVLTLMELTNLKTRATEQRVECDSGVTIERRGVKITANRLRYSLSDHTVELLDGVRGTFDHGNIQSQRTFWTLNTDVVQMPDPSTGTLDGNDFTAQSLSMDLKNGRRTANKGTVYFRTDSEGNLLPGKRVVSRPARREP